MLSNEISRVISPVNVNPRPVPEVRAVARLKI